MPKQNLTEKSIGRIKAPDPSGRQIIHWDITLRGFGILVSGTTNARSYVVQRDLPNGKTKRVTLAAVAELPLTEARKKAGEMLFDLRRGVDPALKTKKMTLQSCLDQYLAARKDLRPASIRVYRQIEKYLKPWMDELLTEIDSDMVEDRHRSLAEEVGESTANGVMRTLRVLWNFAADRDPDLPRNPIVRLKRQWFREVRRERMVRSDELPKFYQAVRDLANPIARDYLTLMLFTGLRRTEAATLRWDDIDLIQSTIRVRSETTKSGRRLDMPIGDFVNDMLLARRKKFGKGKFVFEGPGIGGHISNTEHPLRLVAKASGVTVSAHDLRRTFLTVAESIDVGLLVMKALANHSLGNDVTSGYVQMTVERLREPVRKIEAKMKALCGIKG